MKIFICTDDEQNISAKVSKSLIEKNSNIPSKNICIINEKDFFELDSIKGQKYLRNGKWETLKDDDLQRFTLLRFIVPSLMNYKGEALVIDPDIFLVKKGIEELSQLIKNFDLLCRKGFKRGTHATSLMYLNCSKLKSWDLKEIIKDLLSGSLDYDNLINLKNNNLNIGTLNSYWNDFDNLDNETIFLHTTQKVTQPWRKGLPLNSYIPPILGFIKRDFIYKLFNKPLRIGVEHPNPEINKLFLYELNECVKKQVILRSEIEQAVIEGYIRKDIFEYIN